MMRPRECLYLSLLPATNTNTAITIIQRNLTVRDDQEAVFMCEVPCTHEAFWYVAGLHNSFALPYTDTLSELTYSRSYSACTSAGRYNDTLTLTATPELNNVPIQCSASMIDCNSGDDSCGFIVYSRFRILRGTYILCVCVCWLVPQWHTLVTMWYVILSCDLQQVQSGCAPKFPRVMSAPRCSGITQFWI